MNKKRKLEQLCGGNFNSSPYPQATEGEIEALTSSVQLIESKFRRSRERKELRRQINLGAHFCEEIAKQHEERERADENSRRGWMHDSHQKKSLMMRNLEMAEMKRSYNFERKYFAMLKERLMEIEKEDAPAARSLAGSISTLGMRE